MIASGRTVVSDDEQFHPHHGGPALLGWFPANRFPYPANPEDSP